MQPLESKIAEYFFRTMTRPERELLLKAPRLLDAGRKKKRAALMRRVRRWMADNAMEAPKGFLRKMAVSGLFHEAVEDRDAPGTARLASVPEIIEKLSAGQAVIVVDDRKRENEGDLVCAARHVTPRIINFMRKECGGLICLALSPRRCDQLHLPQQVTRNTSRHHTAFTVSIEAREGVTTGISAADRAHTIKTAIAPNATPEDLVQPGHVFPIRARAGGCLVRAGHTEAAVDLAGMAGLDSSAVICEIMKDDGSMARMPDLEHFAAKHGFEIVTIADIIRYRARTETLVNVAVETDLPTEYGRFRLYMFESTIRPEIHLALVMGDIKPGVKQDKPILVRVHSECLTGDALGSLRCDCGPQLHEAQRMIAREGKGVLVYMHQEGRGIGLENKLRAYALQDAGADTVEANHMLGFKSDLRDYGLGAQILKHLGIVKMRLITNNPKKLVGLEGHGLEIVERVPLIIPIRPENANYLETKKNKMGHLL